MSPEFQAILFDLDGVIVLSEDLHARAKQVTLEKYGIAYPDNLFKDFKGRPDLVFWNHVSEKLALGRFLLMNWIVTREAFSLAYRRK